MAALSLPMPILFPEPSISVNGSESDSDARSESLESITPLLTSPSTTESEQPSPSNQSQSTLSTLSVTKKPMQCSVCGDRATGVHYQTPSCNGCKTFFRRAVIAERKFVCRNGGNCALDKDGRCGCRACRFQKCVEAGMNVNAIQHSPSVNLTLSVARKRVLRHQHQKGYESGSADENLPSTSKSPLSPIILGIHDALFKTINTVLRIDEKHNRLRLSTWNPYVEQYDLLNFLGSDSAYGNATRYPLVTQWPSRPKEYLDKRIMKDREIKFWYFCDLALSVEYMKTFEFFNELHMADKISWARHASIAGFLLFSSYYAYTKRSQVVIFPDGSLPFHFKRENDLIPMERTIRHSVVDKMYDLKMDRIQFALTRSLVALTDAPPDASSKMRDIFLTEKSKYATCLLRYLQSRHGTQNGLNFFVDTINLISLLFRRVEVNKSYYAYRACLINDIGASRLMAQLLLDQQ